MTVVESPQVLVEFIPTPFGFKNFDFKTCIWTKLVETIQLSFQLLAYQKIIQFHHCNNGDFVGSHTLKSEI